MELKDIDELEIVKVYEFYDQPCLYSCKDKLNNLYLVIYADRTHDVDTWLYKPLSPLELEELTSKSIDLKDTFKREGVIYKVVRNRFEGRVESIDSKELTDDWLPLNGEYL